MCEAVARLPQGSQNAEGWNVSMGLPLSPHNLPSALMIPCAIASMMAVHSIRGMSSKVGITSSGRGKTPGMRPLPRRRSSVPLSTQSVSMSPPSNLGVKGYRLPTYSPKTRELASSKMIGPQFQAVSSVAPDEFGLLLTGIDESSPRRD